MRLQATALLVAVFSTMLSNESAWTAEATFRRGDVDDSGEIDISDAVRTLSFLFLDRDATPPPCMDACDSNDDGVVDISDPVRTLQWLFLSPAPLPPPADSCGPDPTGDALACEIYMACNCPLTPLRRLYDAGELPLDPETQKEGDRTQQEADLGNRFIVCTLQDITTSDIREMGGMIALDVTGTTLYPGALIQGEHVLRGTFAPITIPRSGGTIVLGNLVLDPSAKYYTRIGEIGYGNVQQGIQDLLSQGQILGTTARSYYLTKTVYDYDHLLWTLGVDARFGSASMAAKFKYENTQYKNYSCLQFVQVFYDVAFEDPELATSVFRDGSGFSDPECQIRPGNPPLYVSKITYGRMVFLVAESEISHEELDFALSAAYNGLLGSAQFSTGRTASEILARSSMQHHVVGGAAGLAVAAIEGSAQDMFERVKHFISSKDAAEYGPSNPGAPIAYTLNYLSDRTVARMSYNVSYQSQKCSVVDAPEVQIDPLVYRPPHTRGDRDFSGNGPRVVWQVQLQVSPDQSRLQARWYMKAVEWEGPIWTGKEHGDSTTAEGWQPWVDVYWAPAGRRIVARSFNTVGDVYVDWNHDPDVFDINREFVSRVSFYGDGRGDEAGQYTGGTVWFRPVRITLE